MAWQSLSPGTGSGPVWTKYTKTFADFNTSGFQNRDVELFSLPAKTIISCIVVKHTVAFGGSINAFYLSIGLAADFNQFTSDFDVLNNAVSSSNAQNTVLSFLGDFTGVTSVRINGRVTGGIITNTTVGSVDIWVQTNTVPA